METHIPLRNMLSSRILTLVILIVTIQSAYASFTPDHHFWTTDINGEKLGGNDWKKEGPAATVINDPASFPGAVPVYRWYSEQDKTHFWTTDISGEKLPKDSFKLEGIAFYAYKSQAPGTIPFYRWLSKDGDHFWTIDPNGELLPKPAWNREGIAAFVYPPNTASKSGQTTLWRFFQPLTCAQLFNLPPGVGCTQQP